MNEEKLQEVLDIVREERVLNNARFTQVSSGVIELTRKVDGIDRKIDKIQVFASDLEKTGRRVDKIERKIA